MLRNVSRLIVISAFVVALSALPASTDLRSAPSEFGIRPVIAEDSSVTDQTIERWVQTANNIIADGVGSIDDYQCGELIIRQARPVERSAAVSNNVTTLNQRNRIRNIKQGNVVVVESLHHCGRFSPTSFAGCEGSGPILLVNDAALPQHDAGRTLIHEIGHRVGLHHTAQTCPVPLPRESGIPLKIYANIMYCRAHSQRSWISEAQCRILKNGLRRSRQSKGVLASAVSSSSSRYVSNATDVNRGSGNRAEEFLLYGFDEGTPIEEIAELSIDDVRDISIIVQSDRRDVVWSRAAIIVALRGGEADFDAVIYRYGEEAARSQQKIAIAPDIAFSFGIFAARFPGASRERALNFLISKISDPETPQSIITSLVQSVALSGSALATKALIDRELTFSRSEGGSRVSRERRRYVEAINPGGVIVSDPSRKSDLSFHEATEIAKSVLAVKSVGVVEYLRNPNVYPVSNEATLRSLDEEAKTETIPPLVRSALVRAGVQQVRQWADGELGDKLK